MALALQKKKQLPLLALPQVLTGTSSELRLISVFHLCWHVGIRDRDIFWNNLSRSAFPAIGF